MSALPWTPGWVETERLHDHWEWRPEWTADRPRLMWYLTFERKPEVGEALAGSQAGLRTSGADVIPARWLHLTLGDVGFASEVDAHQARRVVAAVAHALREQPPIPMVLGPVGTMRDAVVLSVDPVDVLTGLRERVLAATFADGRLPLPPDDEPFWPHVSLCYLNALTDQRALRAAVLAAPPAAVAVACDRLTLAVVDRVHGHYRWRTLAQVALAQVGLEAAHREHHARPRG